MDGISTCGPKEEVTLRVVVRMPPQHIIKGVRNFRESSNTIIFIQEYLGSEQPPNQNIPPISLFRTNTPFLEESH